MPNTDANECAQPSLGERIAEQFYEWELRGRGWRLFDEPVEPEPPFVPFFGYFAEPDGAGGDDGRTHTLLSGFVDWLHRTLTGSDSHINRPQRDDTEPESLLWRDPGPLVEMQIALPASTQITADIAEQFLLSLNGCTAPLVFEIVGTSERIVIQIVCHADDAEQIREQLEAYFPDATAIAHSDYLEHSWQQADGGTSVIAELGLSREFMLPLACDHGTFKIDPLTSLIAVLGNVTENETALVQILFRPVQHPWAESILRSVVFADGTPLFAGPRDFVRQARSKVSRPLYGAVVRVASRSVDDDRAWELTRRLVAAFAPLSSTEGNELIPIDNDGYDSADHEEDLLRRRSRRGGIILNSTELATLAHFPSASVQIPKLRGLMRKTKSAPPPAGICNCILGQNEHTGLTRQVALNVDQRVRHTHILGASGTGKSTLLLNMIMQDIRRGDGVAVLDPHGDLVDDVIARLPPDRVNDVILFDPADEEFPIGFNILSAHSTLEKNLLASDLVGVFRRLSTSWGDQMNAVLANAIVAFLESNQGGTLLDLRRFLVEREFRSKFLETVQDPEVVYYWTKEFPLLTGKPQGPVLTRLRTFLSFKTLRHMVGQKSNRLNFAEIMDSGRIFLARLSHGAIGEENAELLGALLVAKFNQLAMGRQQTKESERRYFWLYVDEFQHFATPSMASLLSSVRKYRLGLVLAHQEMHALESRSPDVASAVVSNAHTRICFRVGDHDARKLAEGFSSFEAHDLQNLGIGEAICRLERSNFDFNLKTNPMDAIEEAQAAAMREGVLACSREQYASRRDAVERELMDADLEAPVAKLGTSDAMRKLDAVAPAEERTMAPELSAIPTTVKNDRITAPPQVVIEKKRKSERSEEPAPLGRGGPEHKYLQQLIKQWAEGLGYRATIEKQVAGGSIDVVLEKKQRSIACETSVTTSCDWEFGNVRKCLKAGFLHVLMVSPDPKKLAKLKGFIEPNLEVTERERVRFFLPEEMFAYVQDLDIGDLHDEQLINGYKIKRSYRSVDAAENAERRQRVSRVVAGSIRRLKGKK